MCKLAGGVSSLIDSLARSSILGSVAVVLGLGWDLDLPAAASGAGFSLGADEALPASTAAARLLPVRDPRLEVDSRAIAAPHET